MKLSEIVCFESVIPVLAGQDRDSIIHELVNALVKAGKIKKTNAAEIADAVITREKEASTGIGKGVAVPHSKHKLIKNAIAAIGLKPEGIDFDSLDKKPVYSIILLLSPADNPDQHLHAMESIFSNLQKDDFRNFLKQATTVEQIKDVICDADTL